MVEWVSIGGVSCGSVEVGRSADVVVVGRQGELGDYSAPRPGRNPYEQSTKSCSYTALPSAIAVESVCSTFDVEASDV